MTTPPTFVTAYSPASDWSTTTTPKTQTVTTSTGDVLVVLGGSEDSSTTLGTPTDGTNTYALQQNSLVASTCGGYSWATGGPPGQLAVTTTSLPNGTEGTAYTATLAATGGTGAGYTWAISSGALPSWATLTAATGVISGTPNAAATTDFTVQVTDSGSNQASKPLGITVTASGGTAPVGPGGTWTLVFEDQFPGTSLNPANWTALEGASINSMTTHASNVTVSGGYCRLQLASSSSGATINSNPSNDGYGSGANGPVLKVGDCCEAYINFPGASGDSAYNWPAWWAAGGSWPSNGEEDIWEAFTNTPSALNYHSPSGSNNGPNPSGSWCNSFHTYTLVRGSGTNGLKCYWDGVLVREITANDSGGPQSLLITVGNGGDNNSYGSAGATLVKYVRMWTPG